MKIARRLCLIVLLALAPFFTACPRRIESTDECRCYQVGGKTICNSACPGGPPKKVR